MSETKLYCPGCGSDLTIKTDPGNAKTRQPPYDYYLCEGPGCPVRLSKRFHNWLLSILGRTA